MAAVDPVGSESEGATPPADTATPPPAADVPRADVSEEPPPEYQALIQEAVRESAAEHWTEARSLFRQAHQVFPNARALRGVGMSSFELRDYTASYRALRASLIDERRALDFELRAQVEALLVRVEALIARYTLDHLGEGAQVSVDGVRHEPEPDGLFLMSTGRHDVAVELPDGGRSRGTWVVRGGETGPLPVEPPSVPSEPDPRLLVGPTDPLAAPPAARPGESNLRLRRAGAWTSVGAGAAMVLAGAALVGYGVRDLNEVRDAQEGTPWAQVASAYDSGPRRVRGGAVLLGLGGAALAAGLGVVLRLPRSEDDGSPATALHLSPRGAELEVSF